MPPAPEGAADLVAVTGALPKAFRPTTRHLVSLALVSRSSSRTPSTPRSSSNTRRASDVSRSS